MRSHWFVIFALLGALSLSACYKLKPEPLTTAQIIDEQVNEFESALNDLDYAKLKELLADQLMLDWESVSKEDFDKIIAFIGDIDDIETAVLTEISRSILDGNVIIDAELYLELIRNQEKYTKTKTFSIFFEYFGTKWYGDVWLITSMISYSDEYQYQDPRLILTSCWTVLPGASWRRILRSFAICCHTRLLPPTALPSRITGIISSL